MYKNLINSLLFMLCTELFTISFADVAPPIFPGYTLSPFDTKDVRMKSEKIDIYYGDVCKVIAVYEIMNPTKAIVEKKIGFSINVTLLKTHRRNPKDTSKIYDFSMSLNGTNIVETDVPEEHRINYDKPYWYGWTCKFNPGRNTVKLTYNILTSSTGQGRWEKYLSYYLYSDRNWTDKIENIDVTIHFPEGVEKRQILDGTSPSGYEIKKNEICWHFISFTPDSKSLVCLQMIDFKIFADMLRYEKVLSSPNTDNVTKLSAAKFFASLAPGRGINMSAPSSFTKSYYEKVVLPNLKPPEKLMFDSVYEFYKNKYENEGFYTTKNYTYFWNNDSLRKKVIKVMNRIGYFEKIQYPVTYKYIVGAKRLFHEVVTSEPKNADAWKAYIDNFYLIESGACYPCLPWTRGRCDCPESQKEIVKEAYRNCGNDKIIALWYEYLFPSRAPLPSIIELEDNGQSEENITIKIKHMDHSWSDRTLTPDDLNILKKVYKKTDKLHFVLSNTNLDENTQSKLVDILGGCQLYGEKFCSDLERLKTGGK